MRKGGGKGAQASQRGRGRPSRHRSLRRRRCAAEETALGEDRQVVEPQVVESVGCEPEPLVDTDLAVVPIDPRDVLWAVERMIRQ